MANRVKASGRMLTMKASTSAAPSSAGQDRRRMVRAPKRSAWVKARVISSTTLPALWKKLLMVVSLVKC